MEAILSRLQELHIAQETVSHEAVMTCDAQVTSHDKQLCLHAGSSQAITINMPTFRCEQAEALAGVAGAITKNLFLKVRWALGRGQPRLALGTSCGRHFRRPQHRCYWEGAGGAGDCGHACTVRCTVWCVEQVAAKLTTSPPLTAGAAGGSVFLSHTHTLHFKGPFLGGA